MLNLIPLSPSIFPLDQRTELKCANKECGTSFMFCDAIVWNYHDGSRSNNNGFCSHTCALDCMQPSALPRA